MVTPTIVVAEQGLIRPISAWARPSGRAGNDLDAGLQAGATLGALDTIIRMDPPFLGALRCRLALTAAAASAKLIGRGEDSVDLRDAWCLRRPGDALGPASALLKGWRDLARQSGPLGSDTLRGIAETFGLSIEPHLSEIVTATEQAGQRDRAPLHSAAHLVATVCRLQPQAELLGLWLADFVLAQRLRWPRPFPLLVSHLASPALRAASGGKSLRPGQDGWERHVTLAYAHASASAVDLAGDLGRRAAKLHAIAPKLRAKGAATLVTAFLNDDAIAPSSRLGGMSDRGLRRLCDRLVTLGAIRELTNRATFRLYGL